MYILLVGGGCTLSYTIVYLITGIVLASRTKAKRMKIIFPAGFVGFGALAGLVVGLFVGCATAMVYTKGSFINDEDSPLHYVIPLVLGIPIVVIHVILSVYKRF